MPRDWLRDSRGGTEGVARAAHGHEDAPQLPVRVQTSRKQVAGKVFGFLCFALSVPINSIRS